MTSGTMHYVFVRSDQELRQSQSRLSMGERHSHLWTMDDIEFQLESPQECLIELDQFLESNLERFFIAIWKSFLTST